jgi:hypothetical protein
MFRNDIHLCIPFVIRTILLCFALATSIHLSAEGTKQLRPYYEANAHIVVMRTPAPSADAVQNNFASYTAGVNSRLQFTIRNTNERIYLGFGRYLMEQQAALLDAITNPGDVGGHSTAITYVANMQLRFRIVRPDNTFLVAETPVPLPGAVGYIGDERLSAYNRSVAGPAQLVGLTGYNALVFTPDQVGDYYIEFTIFRTTDMTYQARKTSLQLFDLTVASGVGANTVTTFDGAAGTDPGAVTAISVGAGTGVEIPGRLWSRGWRLSTGANFIGDDGNPYPGGTNGTAGSGITNNLFVANMFPYSDDGVVTRINFNGMDPFGLSVYCTQNGIANPTTGDFVLDKRSVYGLPPDPPGLPSPLYRIFLQNPDIIAFPSGSVGCLVGVTVKQCALDDLGNPQPYCINVDARRAGTVDVLINLDNDPSGVFNSGGRDVLKTQNITVDGVTCVPWDGKDGLGVDVPDGEVMQIIVLFRAGLTNLPVNDVEQQRNGIIVTLERPTTNICMQVIAPPKLYWDDTDVQLNVGTIYPDNSFYPAPPSAQATGPINLVGCNPATLLPGEGCHKWGNRGKNPGAVPGNPMYPYFFETMNTWWYVAEDRENVVFTNDLSLFTITPNLGVINCVFDDGGNIDIDVLFSRAKFDFTGLNYFIILPMGVTYKLDFQGIINNDVDPSNMIKRTIRLRYRLDIGADNVYTPGSTQLGIDFRFRVETNQCGSPQNSEDRIFCNVTLPVNLVAFTGKFLDAQTTKLEWKTVSEKSNKGFYVERSTDGGSSFSEIGFVQGSGSTEIEKNYQFIDKVPFRGRFYYRLRQVDLDGTESYSRVINLTTDDLELDFMHAIYNQETHQLQVVVKQSKADDLQVSIYTMLGVELHCLKMPSRPQELVHTFMISLSVPTTGTYIVEVKDSRNIAKKKIVVY